MTRRPLVQSLFPPGALPSDERHGGQGDVTLTMRVLQETDKAWLLTPEGVPSAKSAWCPKRLATRGEGLAERQFTMKRFTAHERGWLR